jgi:signal transduction histidine kinase
MLFVESHRIYIFNLLVLVAIPLQMAYALYNFFQFHYFNAAINFLNFPFLLIGYLTIQNQSLKFLRSFIVFFSSLLACFTTIWHNSGNQFILLSLILVALILYDSWVLFIVHILISISCIIIIRFRQFHDISFSWYFVVQNVNFIVSIFCFVCITFLFKWFYVKQYYEVLETNKKLQLHLKELANSNAELEKFVYITSHDLQEPLRMITNFLQLFEKKYQGIVDDTGKKYIQFAIGGATRMGDLIRDLLQYSHVASGSMELTAVDMNGIMQEMLVLFENEMKQKNIPIVFSNLPTISAVRISMLQMMQNLIGNALKYHGESDPVIIVSSDETNTEWFFSVKDNGIGIDPIYAEKIFMPFQRLHLKEDYEGTGIGLSICKKIIERMKGEIWVESELGKGACFKFSIPKIGALK